MVRSVLADCQHGGIYRFVSSVSPLGGSAAIAPVLMVEQLAVQFGPAEYVGLIVLVLAMVGLLTSASLARMAGALCVGLLLSTVGVDPRWGIPRFMGGIVELESGLDSTLVLVAFVLLPRLLQPALPLWWRSVLMIGVCTLLPLEQSLAEPALTLGSLALLGVFGVALYRAHVPSLVLFCAFSAGLMLEENLSRALMLARGDLWLVMQRPMVQALLGVLLLCVLARVLLGPVVIRRCKDIYKALTKRERPLSW